MNRTSFIFVRFHLGLGQSQAFPGRVVQFRDLRQIDLGEYNKRGVHAVIDLFKGPKSQVLNHLSD